MPVSRLSLRLLLLLGFSLLSSAYPAHILNDAEVTAPEDTAALQAFLNTLTGSLQVFSTSWYSGANPCAGKWIGVTCGYVDDYGISHVTKLELSGFQLKGHLVPDFGNIAYLTKLDLSFNPGLNGPIVPQLGQLKNLENLNLMGCDFSGTIPPELGKLSNLKLLQLNGNKLAGSIPSELGLLSKVWWFDISRNHLSGPLPMSNSAAKLAGLDNLTSAKHIILNSNNLTGNLSGSLSSLPLLQSLLLDYNALSGLLPEGLSISPVLEILSLEMNNFSSPIPALWTKIQTLKILVLASNQLYGSIPDFTNLTNLEKLDVSNNALAGTFPTLAGNNIQFINLANNYMNGPIPAGVMNFSNLQSLLLQNNMFNGSIPDPSEAEDHPLENLVVLDMSSNNLIGQIPLLFSHNPNLSVSFAGNPACQSSSLAAQDFCQASTHTLLQNPQIQLPCPQTICPGSSTPNSFISSTQSSCVCSFQLECVLVLDSPPFAVLTAEISANMQQFLADLLHINTEQLFVSEANITKREHQRLRLQFSPDALNESVLSASVIHNITATLGDHSKLSLIPEIGLATLLSFNDPIAESNASNNAAPKSSVPSGLSGAIVAVIVTLFILGIMMLVCLAVILYRRRFKPNDKMEGLPIGCPKMDYQIIRKATNNFDESLVVHRGAVSTVYKGRTELGEDLLFKKLSSDLSLSQSEFHPLVSAMCRAHHKNLMSPIGFCQCEAERILVYKNAANGCLADTTSGRSKFQLPVSQRMMIGIEIGRGLSYLHNFASPPIIHGCLEASSVYLDEKYETKLCDFGLGCFLNKEVESRESLKEVSAAKDVFDYGLLLVQLLAGRSSEISGPLAFQSMKEGIVQELNLASSSSNSLLLQQVKCMLVVCEKCTEMEASERPSMSDVVRELEHCIDSKSLSSSQTDHSLFCGSYELSCSVYGSDLDHSGNLDCRFCHST